MAPPGKFRNKRGSSSSSSSYSSTLTTVGFIALCVFGVWMLTSDSMVPPDTSSAVIVEDPTTARLVDKAADLESKSAQQQQDVTLNPKVEEKPETQPQPEIATETLPADPHKAETDVVPAKEENLNQDHDEKSNRNQDHDEKSNQNQDQPEQNSQKEEPVEQNNQNQDFTEQNKKTEDQVTQNQEQANQEEQKTTNEDQNEPVNQEEQKSPNENQSEQQQAKQEDQSKDQNEESNRNEDQTEQKSENEKTTQPRDDSAEVKENSNPIPNSSVEREQEQEQEKQNAEEDKGKQKAKAEAEKAHEVEEKQQGERQNMLSTGEQHKQTSDHKLNGHEFSDQTNNPDSKSDPEEGDSSNSKSHQQQQADENKNSNVEAKQREESNPFPAGDSSGIPKETKDSKAWSTQAVQSENQNERHASNDQQGMYGYTWQLCNETVGSDFIPCLDNEKVLKRLRTTRHFQHRERHCPEDPPTCLVPLPDGYKSSIAWPRSRDKIWYHNVPHTSLVDFKGHQNWVKLSGEFLKFPGGGTQFIHGAHYYIDFIQQSVPDISWGKHIRVTLDVGCGVASFGGYLFDKDVLTMSFAPKDEHEAQVQFALERGIPAISAVMGTQRLPFPSRVFDLVHCARCRVPWHEEGGRLLMELNRVLRPGGFFVWSATPVYEKYGEDMQIWNEMSALTISMCFELVTIKRNKINKIAAAIYRKPTTNECYEQRKQDNPPMCKDDDDANAAWYVPLQTCMHRIPVDPNERGSQWPEEWPARVQEPPYWLNSSQMGIYGKPAPEDFSRDYVHWKRVVERSYMKGLGIDWSNVRNVMDMRAVYGGFAAALKDLKVWVLNVVNTDSPDTLPIIYERGLFGIYHDWCESFSSYPRTYDLLHADHLFSRVKKRCKIPPLMAEIDRLVRPGGKLIVRDEADVIGEVENLLRSLRWEVRLIFSKNQAGLLSAQKTDWRPDTYVSSSSSI